MRRYNEKDKGEIVAAMVGALPLLLTVAVCKGACKGVFRRRKGNRVRRKK